MSRNQTFFASVVLLGVVGIALALVKQPSLDRIHQHIAAEHQQLNHITADQLLALKAEETVVFDVRESEEFAVSHINGAIQIPPDVDAAEFTEDYADLLNGKTAVFYCSVGRRSSDLLARLESSLRNAGAKSSANLEGGIFNWVNQEKPLSGNKVHPYNAYWGRLINDSSNISYSPESTKHE